MPANPRHLLVLWAIGLASVLVPTSASAHSLPHGARATEQALGSGYNTPHRSAFARALQPRPARKPASELPITPVLLGLLALGLALGSYSYRRARRATGKARAPTPLRITPIPVPHAWQAPLGPRSAEHEERQR